MPTSTASMPFCITWEYPNFHVRQTIEHENYQEDSSESEDNDSNNKQEEFVEQTMERLQAEEEERNMDDLSVDMSD
eukprot:10267682-Ditylum_brightwellii.AAC.1